MSTDDASAALSQMQTTLLILGTTGPSGPHYMVGNWGIQASFDPWRFVMLLKKEAHTLAYAKKQGAFTVNLLDASQKRLVADIIRVRGDGRRGEAGPAGAPRLPEAFAGIDCKVLETHDIGGDHVLVVADIVDGWKKGDGPALTVREAGMNYSG